MDQAVERLLLLAGAEDSGPAWQLVDRWSRRGQVQRLVEAGAALAERVGESGDDSVLERIERLLSLTPDLDHAQRAIDLAITHVGSGRRRRAADLAAWLADGQPADVLARLVGAAVIDEPSAEVWACLIQELVLREVDIEVAELEPLLEQLHEVGHSLASLPATLLAVEANLALPSFSLSGSGVSMVQGLGRIAQRDADARPVPVLTVSCSSTAEQRRRIQSVVRTWLDESNGLAEAEIYAFSEEVRPAQVGAWAPSFVPMDCLQTEPSGDPVLRPASTNDVVRMLFGATNGGAYGSGQGGAYGRAATWETVAALIGADSGATLDEVAALADGCSWWLFDAMTPWFRQAIWQLGVATLRADCRTFAVLAAADTD